MLKRVKHGKTGCFGKFLSRDNFNLFKKCLKLTLNCQKTEVFVVFDAISVQFPRDFVPIQSTQQQKKTSYALQFLKRKSKRFAKNILQKDSEAVENIFVFVQLVYFLNRFGVRVLGNVQQRLNS